MTVYFKGVELIRLAIQLEANGYDFYRESAAKLPTPEAVALFSSLADKELDHKKVFESLLARTGEDKTVESYPGEHAAYLKAFADSYVFTVERLKAILAASRIDEKEALQFGIESEKDTILFYTGMRGAIPEDARPLIDRILAEEHGHFVQLVQLLRDRG